MVTFVGDEKGEAVADEFHLQYRRIIGADGQILNAVGTAAEHADRNLKKTFQYTAPLGEQFDRRYQYQRRTAQMGDRHDRQNGFPGSGGQ